LLQKKRAVSNGYFGIDTGTFACEKRAMEQLFSIRPATPEDLPAILGLEQASHVAPWSEAHFREEMEKPYSRLWVMTDDETDEVVAGYIVFWLMMEECQILDVVVGQEFRRRGFGETLLRKALGLAMKEGMKKAVLDVRKSNAAAIGVYQKIGFTVAHIRKNFYSNGEDGMQMVLSLEEDGIRF